VELELVRETELLGVNLPQYHFVLYNYLTCYRTSSAAVESEISSFQTRRFKEMFTRNVHWI
jgi:hypothetical protein